MEQNMTLNSTLSEEDKIVDVVQGGLLPWGVKRTPHHGFVFRARTKRSYKKNFKDFFAITHDIMKCFAKDKVVYSSCQYEVKKHGKKTLFKDWIPPEYIEDGRTNELKQYLIQSNRKDLIWSDYMRYISDVINILFIPTEVRDYARDIYVLQEHFDWELITKIGHLAFENKFRTANLCVFPHSEIIHKSNDDETVQSYVNNKDWMIDIAYDACICNDIAVFPNPKYVTYEQLLQITEPIFAKYGWKFGKIENPYLKSFGCNMHCHDCNSYCNSNHNPEKWIKEERVNLGEKLE